jgi:DNA-binding NtrC family response regulator
MKALNFSIFKSKEMSDLYLSMKRLSKSDVNAMILGETGVGKTEAARWIHENSKRSGKPFYTLDAGSLSTDLLRSALFGVRKGAYTDCQESKPGILEKCDGGTLFLDEIGNLGRSSQEALLTSFTRKNNEWVFSRVGCSEMTKVDVRLISATNKNFDELVNDDLLREDFYHRITTGEITIPSLRNRKKDIKPLVNYYVELNGETNNLKITEDAIEILMGREWNGNIRSLFACLDLSVMYKSQENSEDVHLCAKDLIFKKEFKRRGEPVQPAQNFLASFSNSHIKAEKILTKSKFKIDLESIPENLIPAVIYQKEYSRYCSQIVNKGKKLELCKKLKISLPTFRKRLNLVIKLNEFIDNNFE